MRRRGVARVRPLAGGLAGGRARGFPVAPLAAIDGGLVIVHPSVGIQPDAEQKTGKSVFGD